MNFGSRLLIKIQEQFDLPTLQLCGSNVIAIIACRMYKGPGAMQVIDGVSKTVTLK